MTGTDVFASGLDQIRRSWAWFLTFGILLMLLGILCVAKAQTATKFSILALGWVLAISGVIWLLNAFRAIGWHGFFLYLLNGIIRAVTGFLLLRHPDAGAAGVTMLIASLFMVGGIFRATAASTNPFPMVGLDATVRAHLPVSWDIPSCDLACHKFLLYWLGDRHRPALRWSRLDGFRERYSQSAQGPKYCCFLTREPGK